LLELPILECFKEVGAACIYYFWFYLFVVQELVDGGLLEQLSPRTSDLVPVLTQLLIPPTEIDGTILKQKCAQINKALEVLSDILLSQKRGIL